MQCTSPIRIMVKNKHGRVNPLYPDGLDVPCGKCIGCRIKKRKEWSLRMLHELNYHTDSCFVTLTYSDEYLPNNASLVKADLQKYFKRVRRDLTHPIKYFACGEYGDENGRPHYHMIMFGLGPKHHNVISSNWPFGIIDIGLAEPDSINYVAGYIDKKFSGDLAEQEYVNNGREPVFRICSQGLGLQFAQDNHEQISNAGYITRRGVKQSIPRYYIKKLDMDVSKFEDCSAVEKFTGLYNTYDDVYKTANKPDVCNLVDGVNNARKQSQKNLTARVNLRKRKCE